MAVRKEGRAGERTIDLRKEGKKKERMKDRQTG